MDQSGFYGSERVALRELVFDSQPGISQVNDVFFDLIRSNTADRARILDIGTGNGFVISELLNRYPQAGFQLYGIDSSEDMVLGARQKLGQKSIIVQGDNFSLPFGTGSFDTITAKNVTNFSPSELSRVIREGGFFVFREYGSGKGLVEVANLFPGRLIRSRSIGFYTQGLENAGFEIDLQREMTFKKKYTSGQLARIVEMFPFVDSYSEEDRKTIENTFGPGEVEITSDPIIIVARRKTNETA